VPDFSSVENANRQLISLHLTSELHSHFDVSSSFVSEVRKPTKRNNGQIWAFRTNGNIKFEKKKEERKYVLTNRIRTFVHVRWLRHQPADTAGAAAAAAAAGGGGAKIRL